MKLVKSFFLLASLSLGFLTFKSTEAYGVDFTNSLPIAGDTTDLLNANPGGANVNRVGFFSDLFYDRSNNVYYGLSDRGPGGGVLDYDTRVQKFTLDVNPNTGEISNFNIIETILFTDNGNNFNGLNAELLNGNSSNLGLSFDPEGFVIGANGNFFVSDEYGPSLYEFNPDGTFVRAFNTPSNLLPRDNGTLNYSGTGNVTTGRPNNRGFEGLAINSDGSKLFAMLQDPLSEEGSPDGRYSRNIRIVEFDIQTGQSNAQYIYQLESIADINQRVPSNPFNSNQQGRNIGISAIYGLNDHEFLVLERDNRGLGVDSPTFNSLVPSGSKRVYKIDINGATDVSQISLAGVNDLAANITPVTKSLYLDVAEALANAGQIIPEKLEGLTIGPRLNNGNYVLLLGTDNDYSVTQNNTNTQFNVCTNLTTSSQQALDTPCPQGENLIPGYLYSFQVQVPEPNTVIGLIFLGLAGLGLKRQQS